MKNKLTIAALALSTTALVAPAALAQDIPAELNKPIVINEITLGVQYQGGHNTGQYGRYNGLTTSGINVDLGFTQIRRPAWNSGDTYYYEFSGSNLTFQPGNKTAKGFRDGAYNSDTTIHFGPEADINLAFGRQGEWGVTASYSALTYTGNIISSLWTVNGDQGTLNNGLKPFGGASNVPLTKGTVLNTNFNPTTLTPYFNQVQTGTRRDKVELGGKLELDTWVLATNISHEHKQGSLEESIRQTWGGMAFTLPVDYDTDRFDISASYVDPDYQAVIQYSYSRFTDNMTGVRLPYAVSQTSLSATSGPYAQQSLYSTPPSNSAHYLTVMLSDKLAPKTRVVFNGRVGLELQDDTFAANSANPGLTPTMGNPTYNWFGNLNSSNQGTRGTSLDAQAYVYQANVTFSTELAEHLEGKINYSLDGRDVRVSEFKVWNSGNPDQNNNRADYVVPQNWVKQTGTAELSYLILPESSTRVTASYAFNNTNRTNAQVEHSETNSFDLNISSMLGKDILTRLSYGHSNRAGSMHYGTAWGNLETGAPEEEGTPSGAYYQAPMVSDSVTLRADYAPIGDLSGGVFIRYADNRFHYPEVEAVAIANPSNAGNWSLAGQGQGITNSTTVTMGPDINYRPTESLTLHGYYSYQRIYFDNRGNGACSESNAAATCAGTVGYFVNKYTTHMHSAGFSGDWKISEKLKLSSEYNLSVGSVLFGQFNGVSVANVTGTYQNVTNYPDIDSRMDDIRVTAAYQFTDNIEGALLYRYSMFNNNDWQNVPLPVIPTTNGGSAISIVNAGYGAPNYNVSTVGMTLRVKL
ncbi:hypothetical protein FHS83_000730 [Rhizomicrobium palustre]|uniref:MtrB/PioB family decaheme-associated outer membrane protein n=1 Tax=Rhizomicrobium palustre TaxID=189966 RepID=A0A846MWG2_9PROT|nr:MtrB/PioB family outer membrane beta-barrel protein [Rhizomicrobium palustre]NIK87412.1 hypothetical protein [Rhizomicrobium palustre]